MNGLASAFPLPIYGKVLFSNGQPANGAVVNVSSDLGYLTTVVGGEQGSGYWQVDVGDPGPGWPQGTEITIMISYQDDDDELISITRSHILDEGYLNVGTIMLETTGGANSTGGNQHDDVSPVAQLVNQGFFESMVGKTVFFDGIDSYDSDGVITGYRWDFNGDGLFDTDWLDAGVTTHVYSKAGFYSLVLEVRDDSNQTDIVEGFVDISESLSLVEIIGPIDGLTSEMNSFIYQLSQSKTILNVTWMIDEEVMGYDAMLNHVFRSSGYYLIKVVVIDDMNQSFIDAHQINIKLDTDKDKIADDIENKIDTPIWTKNNATDVIINGISHLLIDTDQDGDYDVFFNTTMMNSSKIKQQDKSLLIDDDLDDNYEYQYDDGVMSSYEDSKNGDRNTDTPGFSIGIIFLVGIIIICIIVLTRKNS